MCGACGAGYVFARQLVQHVCDEREKADPTITLRRILTLPPKYGGGF